MVKLKSWEEIRRITHIIEGDEFEHIVSWCLTGRMPGWDGEERPRDYVYRSLNHGFDWASTGDYKKWYDISIGVRQGNAGALANLRREFKNFFCEDDVNYEQKFEEQDEDCI